MEDVLEDDAGEYFWLYETLEDEELMRNGRKIRPSSPAECDADVDEALRLHNERKAREEAEEKAAMERRERLAEEARDRWRREAEEASRNRVSETLHVGDTIKFEDPVVQTSPPRFVYAQVMSMRDPSGRVEWHHKLDWSFSGFYASVLEPSTFISIVKRKSGEPVQPSRWRWPLHSYLLPAAYEQPLSESDEQKRLRGMFRQANENIENAVSEFMGGGRDDELSDSDSDADDDTGAAGVGKMYSNLRF